MLRKYWRLGAELLTRSQPKCEPEIHFPCIRLWMRSSARIFPEHLRSVYRRPAELQDLDRICYRVRSSHYESMVRATILLQRWNKVATSLFQSHRTIHELFACCRNRHITFSA